MRFSLLVVALTVSLPLAQAQVQDFSPFSIELEGGPSWNTRNDVRIPSTGGTPFSLADTFDTSPSGYFRVYATLRFNPKHSLRFLAAPLRFEGAGTLAQPTSFAGETFAPGVESQAIYEFNTYRFTYGYTLVDRESWKLKIGASGLIRDAKVELQQGGQVARDTDLGIVPLGYVQSRHNLGDRTYFVLDVEGSGAPQGRAIDASAKLHYRLTDRLNLGMGYRTIEGGADVESVYNFAWLNFAAFSLGYDF